MTDFEATLQQELGDIAKSELNLLPQSQVRHTHRVIYENNWMQALEGELDSTHVYFLHSRIRQELPGRYGLWIDDKAARFHVQPTN